MTAMYNAQRCARAGRQLELAPTNIFEIPAHKFTNIIIFIIVLLLLKKFLHCYSLHFILF